MSTEDELRAAVAATPWDQVPADKLRRIADVLCDLTPSGWQPMSSAPKDGSPVWARGWDWGKPNTTRHSGWVFWNDGNWCWAGDETNHATHLTDYLPTPPAAAMEGSK